MADVAVATIVAKPFLSFARALADSFNCLHRDVPFFVLLADEADGYFDPAHESFHIVGLSELDIPHLERFRFQYAQQPLSYASTPYLLAHLVKRGFSRLLFIKQETLVLGDLSPLFDVLETSSILLTPHLTAPLAGADRIERELNILQSGTFNVGILGVAATPVAERFLEWWQDRVHAHCQHAIPLGMHYAADGWRPLGARTQHPAVGGLQRRVHRDIGAGVGPTIPRLVGRSTAHPLPARPAPGHALRPAVARLGSGMVRRCAGRPRRGVQRRLLEPARTEPDRDA
jgi:hypothetical protein